jgi:hypothetical protein
MMTLPRNPPSTFRVKVNLVEVVEAVVHGLDQIIVFANAKCAILDRHAQLNYILLL